MKSHEMIYVFSKKGSFYNRIDIKGDFKGWTPKDNSEKQCAVYSSGMPNGWVDNGNDGTTRCPLSVINMRTKKGNHPTEKPLELYKWLIERYSNAGDTVLDATAGSFNSVLAAQQLGRNGIGIEKDKAFYDSAVARLQAVNEIIPPPTI